MVRVMVRVIRVGAWFLIDLVHSFIDASHRSSFSTAGFHEYSIPLSSR